MIETARAHALRGEVRQALAVLAELDPTQLSPQDREWVQAFRRRFTPGEEDAADPELQDAFVRGVVACFRDYWRGQMLGAADGPAGERALLEALNEHLRGSTSADPAADLDALEGALREELGKRGYHCLLGVVRPFRELMLWQEQEERTFVVSLPERSESEPVRVVLLDAFVLLGWTHFATVGQRYTGGWAKADALYCVKQSYDLESERFRVSYLTHEGQHFADYRRFPDLDQANLEYRAKLAELSLAQESLQKLLGSFARGRNPDPRNPHAFAEHWVIENLTSELGGVPEAVRSEDLNAAALALLRRSSQDIESLGTSFPSA